jgi:hypothetical protein
VTTRTKPIKKAAPTARAKPACGHIEFSPGSLSLYDWLLDKVQLNVNDPMFIVEAERVSRAKKELHAALAHAGVVPIEKLRAAEAAMAEEQKEK